MQQREMKGMLGRYVLFVVVAFGILALNIYFNPPKPKPQARQQEAAQQRIDETETPTKVGEPAGLKGHEGEPKPDGIEPKGGEPTPEQPEPSKPESPAEEPDVKAPLRVAPKPAFVTLGSLDPASPYRSLVTLTNLGAAVVRIELNSPRFTDLEDRSGYLGHVALEEIGHLVPTGNDPGKKPQGCRVDVVGPGTPAALAGLKQGDVITDVITADGGHKVTGFRSLRQALEKPKPKETVELTVLRGGKPLTLSATLGRRPLEVVRPEKDDPLSFLLTLRQVDGLVLDDLIKDDDKAEDEAEKEKSKRGDKERDENIGMELVGLDLRTGAWEIEDKTQFDKPGPHTQVTFFRELPQFGLKISKTFRLAKVPEGEKEDDNPKAYHLVFDIKIENIGGKAREVAYQLDGPTGLPIEGKWYANKVGRGGGLRDVVVSWDREAPNLVACRKIADDKWGTIWKEDENQSLTYLGVDAQYFSAVMIPEKELGDIWLDELQPLRVGAVDKDWKKTTNTSCRLTSRVQTLQQGGKLEHSYTIFAGPKKPPLLAKYGLKDLVYYGWFWFVAIPMLYTLHFFHDYVVFNYGLAILMLTVLVRGCMFPLSRKQALGARKMQELQPEIKKIHEKYKNNSEAKVKAQQELFKKHNYNPLSGCLVLFLQLPIFIGLYRGLMVDVELRQAPLISQAIRWCSNLAAPDMLYDWSWFWNALGWTSVSSGIGFFGLGPYFNLLPILTIALFLMQQKLFMPPAADEQQAMQQRMMKFMMIFMGFIFFKVASGLCLYFIASSLWGLAERKLLPKTSPPGSGDKSKTSRSQEAKPTRRIPRQPNAAQPESWLSKLAGAGSNHDGAAARKKKRRKKKSRGN